MPNRVIVNCGIGWHYAALSRTVETACAMYGETGSLEFWRDYPSGCPTHAERQYAFKIFAIREAIAKYGNDATILWMDSTFIPLRSIEPLWEHIETHGWYALLQGGAKVGEWATDRSLELMELDRETAMQIPLCLSGLVGLNLAHETGRMLWDGWQHRYEAGAFDGAHINKPGESFTVVGNKFSGHCSDDPRVHGHRHDETALSVALWRLGLAPSSNDFTTVYSADGFIGRTTECPLATGTG